MTPHGKNFQNYPPNRTLAHLCYEEKPVFFYRGNLLYAVRFGDYKMHMWTWAGEILPDPNGIVKYKYCQVGLEIEGVLTTGLTKHETRPILVNLKRDPGERNPISTESEEYSRQVALLREIVKAHEESFELEGGFGKPDLNICTDVWCEGKNRCRQKPKQCNWIH